MTGLAARSGCRIKKAARVAALIIIAAGCGRSWAGTISDQKLGNGTVTDRGMEASTVVFATGTDNPGLLFRDENIFADANRMSRESESRRIATNAKLPTGGWTLLQTMESSRHPELRGFSLLDSATQDEEPSLAMSSDWFKHRHRHAGNCPAERESDRLNCRHDHEAPEPNSLVLLAGCLAALCVTRLILS